MAFRLLELTRETSTSTTGPYVLLGAPAGYNPFGAGISNNDVTAYTVFEQAPPGAPVWAEYFGTYSSGGNSLSRGTFIRSSTGADISPWGAGTRNVVCGLQGAQIETLVSLLQAASTGTIELVSGSPMPTFGVYTVSSFIKTLLDDITAGVARTTLSAEKLAIAARGDLTVGNTSGQASQLTIGASERVLGSDGTDPSWRRLLAAWMDYSSAVAPLSTGTIEAVLDQIGGFFADTIYDGSVSPDDSSMNVPAANGSLTWAHGLGIEPKMVMLKLKCITNDATYEAGDVIYVGAGLSVYDGTSTKTTMAQIDATNVVLRNHNGIAIVSETNGGLDVLDTATPDWRWIISAYR